MKRALLMIRQQPEYRRQAFEAGLKRLGYTLIDGYGRAKPSSSDDLMVVWNIKRGRDEEYATAWEQLGGTVVVAENGYLQRVDKTYFALSVGGHNGSGWFPQRHGEDRFSALGFELREPRHGGEFILVRDQRGIGSKLMASPRGWGATTAEKLRRSQPLPVKLMPHPGDGDHKLKADAAALAGAARVVIWASAIGVRALVEGIQVQHHAPHWVCEQHVANGREAALQRMAHGQWHHEEIATGEPFERMRAGGWGALWR